MNPTAEDREFIEGHKIYFEQADLNFLHGMQPHVMLRFEMLYKAYLDPKFVLTTWCSACVVDMMKRLAYWYRNLKPLPHPEPSTGDDVADYKWDNLPPIAMEANRLNPPATGQKKRSRPRKA